MSRLFTSPRVQNAKGVSIISEWRSYVSLCVSVTWKSQPCPLVFPTDDVEDVKIGFEREIFPEWAQLGPDNTEHTIVYDIKGLVRRGRAPDENVVRRELRNVLARQHAPFWVARQHDGNDDDLDHGDNGDNNNSDNSDTQFDDNSRNPFGVPGRSLMGKHASSSSRGNVSMQIARQWNAFIIHDSFRLTADSDADRSAYLDLVEKSWVQILGTYAAPLIILKLNVFRTSGPTVDGRF